VIESESGNLFGEKYGERTHATQLRDDGIAKAAAGARDGWIDRVVEAVRQCALDVQVFTTDDVLDYLAESDVPRRSADGKWLPAHPTALGAVMLQAAKRGICVATGAYVESDRRRSHARRKMQWRSL